MWSGGCLSALSFMARHPTPRGPAGSRPASALSRSTPTGCGGASLAGPDRQAIRPLELRSPRESRSSLRFAGRRDGSDDVHVPDGDGGGACGVALWRPRIVVHREGLARGRRLLQGREQHRLPRRGVNTGDMVVTGWQPRVDSYLQSCMGSRTFSCQNFPYF